MNKKFFLLLSCGALLFSCGTKPSYPSRIAHKYFNHYESTIDGVTYKYQTWQEAYDSIMRMTEITRGDVRNAYLYQAEQLVMSTGAVAPLFTQSTDFLANSNSDGFFVSKQTFYDFRNCSKSPDDKLEVCLGAKFDSLDPTRVTSASSLNYLSMILGGLFRDKNIDESWLTTEIELDLAKSFSKTINPDGTATYVYTLKDDLYFSDGSPLTASDFAWTWSRNCSGYYGSYMGFLFSFIVGYEETFAETSKILPLSGVIADDKNKTLTVTIKGDYPFFNSLAAHPLYAPLNRRVIEENPKDWSINPNTFVGAGSYKVKLIDNVDGGKIVLEKNPNYWDKENVKLKELVCHLYSDNTLTFTNFKNGTLDVTTKFPTSQVEYIKQNFAKQFYSIEDSFTYFLGFNVNSQMLNQYLKSEDDYAKFRKGLSLLIDRNYIGRGILQTGQKATSTFVNSTMEILYDSGEKKKWIDGINDGNGYFPIGSESYSQNCIDGVNLIRESGIPYNEKTNMFSCPTIQILINTNEFMVKGAEYLQMCFSQYGINLKIDSLPYVNYKNTFTTDDYFMVYASWGPDYLDPTTFLNLFLSNSDGMTNSPHLGFDFYA